MNNIIVSSSNDNISLLEKRNVVENYISNELHEFLAVEPLRINLIDKPDGEEEGLYTYQNNQHIIEINVRVFDKDADIWKHAIYHEIMHYDNCCQYQLIREMHMQVNIDYAILIPSQFVIELLAWLKSYSKYQIDTQEYFQPMQKNLYTQCCSAYDIQKLVYNYSIICAISIFQRKVETNTLIRQLCFPNEHFKKIFVDLFTASWRICKNSPSNAILQEFYKNNVYPVSQAIGRYFSLL